MEKKKSSFDPFKASISSTAGVNTYLDQVPTKITDTRKEVEKIIEEREADLEETVEDRELTVFSQQELNSSVGINAIIRLIDQENEKTQEDAEKRNALNLIK